MIHPKTRLRFVSDAVGHGVFATELIPRGTVVWALDPLDQRISLEAFDELPPKAQEIVKHYAYLGDGEWILCWDEGRYVNHSCAPSLRSFGFDAMVATRDILPGEEITCDYAESCNEQEELACLCGAAECRGAAAVHDVGQWAARWDAESREAAAFAGEVAQPLLEYVTDPEGLRALIEGRAPLPSVSSWFVPPPPR